MPDIQLITWRYLYLHLGPSLSCYKGISGSDRDELGTIYSGYLEGFNLTRVLESSILGIAAVVIAPICRPGAQR